MLFWIAILSGVVVAILATRIGFYETFIYTLNLSVSTYLAVYLTPYVITHIPAATEIGAGLPLTLGGLAIGIFIMLHGISYLMFTGQFTIAFPKVIDLPLAAVVGFWAGLLIVALLALVLSLTSSPWAETVLGQGSLEFRTATLRFNCDRIHLFTNSGRPAVGTDQILAWLVEHQESGGAEAPRGPIDPNEMSDS